MWFIIWVRFGLEKEFTHLSPHRGLLNIKQTIATASLPLDSGVNDEVFGLSVYDNTLIADGISSPPGICARIISCASHPRGLVSKKCCLPPMMAVPLMKFCRPGNCP